MNCPECGAANSLCQERFDEFLALEFSDMSYGIVHNLTVTAFMLQHSSRMSKEGWSYQRELLRDFIVGNKSPDLVRQQVKDSVDSGKRTFKFKSKDGKPFIQTATWTKTILDVSSENAEVYCQGIRDWAKSVLEDVQGLEV